MWFKNLQIYRLKKPFDLDIEALDEKLRSIAFVPCGKMDLKTVGWCPPRSNQPEALVHSVAGCFLVTLSSEEKILPSSVVKEFTDERAADIEAQQDRKLGKKERRELQEKVRDELLPRAFSRVRRTFAYIDPLNKWLVVDAASPKKAEELLEMLRKCVDTLSCQPIRTEGSPTVLMTAWVESGEAPVNFTIDDDCELKVPGDEGAVVRCQRQDLGADEVRQHLAAGKMVTKLALTWDDRISIVLTDDLQVRRMQYLDLLQDAAKSSDAETAEEQFDANFAIMTGEVAKLLPDLVEALGGEPADGI